MHKVCDDDDQRQVYCYVFKLFVEGRILDSAVSQSRIRDLLITFYLASGR